ncbi:3-hydroxybutyrate dehydrogenase [Caenispirillum bisanense]|uniref:3-hydroxybutyrate dehydrogenase n=1 Tax=Caenispirillum bisanense TaxID=414052 RepID=A0A286GQB9_9PROT|nr:3-hydroxybutyrate dehydrogenase [Caenispirillum bisanense]SOD97692.1 3-hydroxybutyrate dehydrogenase [Caenispirillum bisanense]
MLTGKTALITGSTSGIGLAMAQALARQGVNIMLNGFGDPDEIEALRAGMEKDCGVRVGYQFADLAKGDDAAALVRRTESEFGGVDILVNNAGIQHTAPTQDFPLEKWDAIIAVNLSAAFHTIRAALPGMQSRDWGRIINVASVHGLVASIDKAAYVAAKHGIVGLTKVVALENAQRHITCNAICPGWVRTPLVQAQIEKRAEAVGGTVEEGARDLVREKQPSQRFVMPENLAALAVFLCTEAADGITGASLPMDGGWTAQ